MELSLNDIHIAKCRKSFHYFIKWCWELSKPGQTFIDEPYVKFLCDHLQKRMEDMRDGIPRKGLLLSIAPATGKSFILSVCAPIYFWLLKSEAAVFCASVNTALALSFSTESRSIIENSEFKKYFDFQLRDDVNSKQRFMNLQGGSRTSLGLETPSIGGHYLLQVLDDVQSLNLLSSEPDRVRINTTLSQHLPSRTGNQVQAQRWLVMQRLSQQDALGYLQSFGLDEVICLPAELNSVCTSPELYNEEGLLAPRLLSIERLNALRTSLGPQAYQAQINQNPGALELALIKPEHFIIENEIPKTPSRLHVFFDGATTTKKYSDYSAAVATLVHGNSIYVIDIFQRKLAYPDLKVQLVEWIKSLYGFDRRTQVYIEPKSSGEALIPDLKFNSSLNVNRIDPPKVSKEIRAQGISARIAAGRVKLIKAGWNNILINEACGLSRHDDLFDCLMYAIDELVDERTEPTSYKNKIGFIDLGNPLPKLNNLFI